MGFSVSPQKKKKKIQEQKMYNCLEMRVFVVFCYTMLNQFKIYLFDVTIFANDCMLICCVFANVSKLLDDRLAISFFNSKRYFNILNLPVKSLAFPIKFEKVNPRLKEKRKVKRLRWNIEKIRF